MFIVYISFIKNVAKAAAEGKLSPNIWLCTFLIYKDRFFYRLHDGGAEYRAQDPLCTKGVDEIYFPQICSHLIYTMIYLKKKRFEVAPLFTKKSGWFCQLNRRYSRSKKIKSPSSHAQTNYLSALGTNMYVKKKRRKE